MKNIKNINNWDLVDLSAPKIIGDYLFRKLEEDEVSEGDIRECRLRKLYKLAKSTNLWKRRVAIISTWIFIRNNEFNYALKISKILINDKHDLIHKAVGWMLREIGKRDQKIEEEFLKKHYLKMPRVMLRYSIEKFSESKRKFYLKKRF